MERIVTDGSHDPLVRTLAQMLPRAGKLNPTLYGTISRDEMFTLIRTIIPRAAESTDLGNGYFRLDYGAIEFSWTVISRGPASCAPFLVTRFERDNYHSPKGLSKLFDYCNEVAAGGRVSCGNIEGYFADEPICRVLSGSSREEKARDAEDSRGPAVNDLGAGMSDAFQTYLSRCGALNPVAYAEELDAASLCEWLLQREAFDLKSAIAGDQSNGFLTLGIGSSEFAFGLFDAGRSKPAFAVFFMLDPGAQPNQGISTIHQIIAGGSILMKRTNVSTSEMPLEVDLVLRDGSGLPLKV